MRTSGACAMFPLLVPSGRRIGTRTARVLRPRIVSAAGAGARGSAVAIVASSTSALYGLTTFWINRPRSRSAAKSMNAPDEAESGDDERDRPEDDAALSPINPVIDRTALIG